MFHSICVAIRPIGDAELLLRFATDLAARQGWEIDGCAVLDESQIAPSESTPLGASAFKQDRDEQRMKLASANAARWGERLQALARQRNVKSTYWVGEGNAATTVADIANRCDLVLCGADFATDGLSRLHDILRHGSRPAMVVPADAAAIEGDWMLAYDGSRQSTRAMAALTASGLAVGRTVHVVTLVDDPAASGAAAESATTYLRRHGLQVAAHRLPRSGNDGAELVAAARRLGASTLAMGAYSRHPLREWLFGSVTQRVLSESPMPVLVDH